MSSKEVESNDYVSDAEGDEVVAAPSADAAFAVDFSDLVITEQPLTETIESYVPVITEPPGHKVMHVRLVWEQLNRNKDYDAFKRAMKATRDPNAPEPEPQRRKNGTIIKPKEDITYKSHPSFIVANNRFLALRALSDAKHAKFNKKFPHEVKRLADQKAAEAAQKVARLAERKRKADAAGDRGLQKMNGNSKFIIALQMTKSKMDAAAAEIWNAQMASYADELQ